MREHPLSHYRTSGELRAIFGISYRRLRCAVEERLVDPIHDSLGPGDRRRFDERSVKQLADVLLLRALGVRRLRGPYNETIDREAEGYRRVILDNPEEWGPELVYRATLPPPGPQDRE